MTNVYNTGTVSVPSNSNIVTGTDTYFQSVGNISEGDLFTLDGKEFYEIYQIDTDSQLRIKHRLSGATYAGDAVSDVSYSIIQSFATDSIAEIAKNVVLLQQNWHRREDEMTGWFNTENNYYQITNQQGERVLVVTPTGLTKLVDGTIDIGDGSALAELAWANIQNIPETASRWARFDEITDKPEHVLGYPSFDKVTGKVSQEQLPDSIETDSKRTQALSPPVKTEPSLSHLLSDYPTLKKTESIPTESPNNRREMLFDDVRELFHVALTDRFLTLPNTVAARKFMVMFSNRYIQLNTAFTGVIEMRVYPLGDGAAGLPTSLTLDNNKWHTFAASVTSLNTIGDGFKGIIDYIRLGNSWETFDSDRSHFSSIDGYYTRSSGDVETPFIDFYLRNDGYWYSADLTPETPQAIGASWAQDGDNKRLYTVTAASDGSDALRFFSDGYDTYEMELILTTNVSGNLALTNGNSDPNIVYYPGTARYFTDDRIYFKRSSGEITGTIEVESIKMRVPNE
jgi:hypothetical protein